MTRAATVLDLHVVEPETGRRAASAPAPPQLACASSEDEAAEAASKSRKRLHLTRKLARAMAKEDKARAALAAASAEVDAAFVPWAVGRSISRDKAREHMASTGLLPERKVWE